MRNDPLRLLAIIPARGGSERLPGKNTRNFGGKPLIAHTIECAQECPALTRTIISTDSEEIAQVAREAGGDIPFMRPERLATSQATSMDVAHHALTWCEEYGDQPYHGVVLLQPTSPLRQARDVQTGIEVWLATGAMLVTSVCSIGCPPSFLVQVQPDGALSAWPQPEHPEELPTPQAYRYNGAVYVYKAEAIRDGFPIGHKAKRAFLMPTWRSADIDTLEDFVRAEAIWAQRRVFDDR